MVSDAATFVLAFASIFLLLGGYLLRLHLLARRLEQRVARLQARLDDAATTSKSAGGGGAQP